MLVCPDDLNVLENFVCGNIPDLCAVRGLVSDIFSRGSEFDVSLYELASEHNIQHWCCAPCSPIWNSKDSSGGARLYMGNTGSTPADLTGNTGALRGSAPHLPR